MLKVGLVHGDAEQAVPLVVGVDTVYVHTDIQANTQTDPVTGETRTDYTYQEVQYGKDEYIQIMAEQTEQNNKLMNAILGVE